MSTSISVFIQGVFKFKAEVFKSSWADGRAYFQALFCRCEHWGFMGQNTRVQRKGL